ncbi:hypothetical protein N9V21_03115 [Candidatus Marinimicrobia bacterium]|nr:hypothetical protein [Candidatus Neomarinimicrobiota bacterium]MDA9735912.1 hypothetical protein [Candidatus Neomarinimicrobiota bacterium]
MKYYNFFIASFIFFITLVSCSKDKENTIIENNSSMGVNESIIDEPLDLSIQNILIYPNQFDKNSIYIDVEILSINGGNGEVQIALLNDKRLVASNSIKVLSNEKNYFQSFMIGGEVDYEKNFEIGISALNGETNISNNKHIFKSSLKIEKPKIAILSGKLNFNTPHIINNLIADYDHFYPSPLNGNLDITDFWFTNYDIILLDNFPSKPVSDKWLKLFLKKIISENSSLIMNARLDQDTKVLKDFFPIFNIKYDEGINLNDFNNFSRNQNGSFKSSFIAINDIFNISKNYISELNEIIDWILKDADIQYSFHIANKYNKLNEPIFIYGYSNVEDSELKNLQAEVLIDDEVISKIKLLYNPISGYYFTQFEPDTSGSYVFNFQNNKKLIDTINVNIYE